MLTCNQGHAVYQDGCLACTELSIVHDEARKAAARTPPPSPEQVRGERQLADYAVRAASAALHLAEKAAQAASAMIEHSHKDGPEYGTGTPLRNAELLVKVSADAAAVAERLDRIADKVFSR